MPLTATLGDLHAAIHALFACEAATCTPPTGAASTTAACASSWKGENEEDARPRDVFPPGGPEVPESFDQAAPAPHSSAFSGLSDRRP